MVDLIMWRGKSTCFPAFIKDFIFPRGNSVEESAAIALYFFHAARKSKDLPTSENQEKPRRISCHVAYLAVQ